MKAPIKRFSFTLVELVVSMGIMMMVAGIVALASQSFYSGYQRAVRVTARLKALTAIDNLMDNHVRNLIPFKWKDENSNSRFVFSGEESRLHFTTLRRTYGKKLGALLFIRIFVEEEKLIAEYSRYPRLPWEEEGDEAKPYEREVVAEGVKAITFTYAELSEEGDEKFEWLDHWAEDEHAALPLAIRMKVEFTDGSEEHWLRRVAGVSANSTFGTRSTVSGDTTVDSSSWQGGPTGGGGQ